MMKLKINKTSINGSRKKNVKKKTKVEILIIKRVKLWFLGNEREKREKKINRWQTRPLAPTPLHMKRENDNAFNDTVKGYFWMLGSAG
jgi:hypothetical protein